MKKLISTIRNLGLRLKRFIVSMELFYISKADQAIRNTRRYERSIEGKIKREAMDILVHNFPNLIMEFYENTIYKFRMDSAAPKSHNHISAIDDIRELLLREIEEQNNFIKQFK